MIELVLVSTATKAHNIFISSAVSFGNSQLVIRMSVWVTMWFMGHGRNNSSCPARIVREFYNPPSESSQSTNQSVNKFINWQLRSSKHGHSISLTPSNHCTLAMRWVQRMNEDHQLETLHRIGFITFAHANDQKERRGRRL